MNRLLVVLIYIGIALPAFCQKGIREESRWPVRAHDRAVNYGLRAGFNSSIYMVSAFKIKDVTIDEIQNNYQIGGFAAFFMRFNINRHYIQPEISYQISRSEITFDKLGSQHPDLAPDYASIHAKIHSVELPVVYGFNIIKKGPYALSAFIGPKVRYLWKKKNKITFENFDQKDMREELHPFCMSGVVGVGVNISRIFFDFRYEQGFSNISKSVTYDDDTPGNIVFRRREAILSFSLGVML